jgi:hypothetical protein
VRITRRQIVEQRSAIRIEIKMLMQELKADPRRIARLIVEHAKLGAELERRNRAFLYREDNSRLYDPI